MGFSLRDCFGPKNPTMQVFADDGNFFVVPLKKIHDEIVFVKLKGVMYLFYLDSRAYFTYRTFGSKPIQTILFSTKDAFPIMPNDIVDLAKYVAKINGAKITPELGTLMLKSSKINGLKEGDVVSIMDIAKSAGIGTEMELEPSVKELEHECGVENIIVPLKSISRFLHDRIDG